MDKALVKHYSHQGSESSAAFSIERARQQHESYLTALRKNVPTICLPPLEKHPDSLFVEDVVVSVGKTAVLTQPGHPSRRGEVDSVGTCLRQLGMPVMDMRKHEKFGEQVTLPTCDGGDVLCTGRHVFIGLSDRTNETGAALLKDLLEDCLADPIPVVIVPPIFQATKSNDSAVLHLKSAITCLDSETLLAPTGPIGTAALRALQYALSDSAQRLQYEALRLNDVLSCNAVSVNGTILAQDTSCAQSRNTLESAAARRNLNLDFVDTSELAKKDAALTCCSVLLDI